MCLGKEIQQVQSSRQFTTLCKTRQAVQLNLMSVSTCMHHVQRTKEHFESAKELWGSLNSKVDDIMQFYIHRPSGERYFLSLKCLSPIEVRIHYRIEPHLGIYIYKTNSRTPQFASQRLYKTAMQKSRLLIATAIPKRVLIARCRIVKKRNILD